MHESSMTATTSTQTVGHHREDLGLGRSISPSYTSNRYNDIGIRRDQVPVGDKVCTVRDSIAWSL